MKSHSNRLAKLETKHAPATQAYMVVRWEGRPAGDPAEQAKGYKIQPVTSDFRKFPSGELFYLPTWDEVLAFEARPNVELTIIEFAYNDEPGEVTE
jgi:hypothetical protein